MNHSSLRESFKGFFLEFCQVIEGFFGGALGALVPGEVPVMLVLPKRVLRFLLSLRRYQL